MHFFSIDYLDQGSSTFWAIIKKKITLYAFVIKNVLKVHTMLKMSSWATIIVDYRWTAG